MVTLLLHLGLAGGLRYLDLDGTPPSHPPEPPLVEVVFAAPPATRTFTELPPDRAEDNEAESPLLSNVDSRARDELPGGEDDAPFQQGRDEFPQVAMTMGELAPPPATASPPEAQRPPDASPSAAASPTTVRNASEFVERTVTARSADPWAAFRDPAPPAPSGPPVPAPSGTSDLAQEAMDAGGINAALEGDISLSTTAWEWAPWLQAFRRKLLATWTAPLGYHLGLIHGWTLLEVVIDPGGTVRSTRVLGEEGNSAFRESSLSAITRSAPYLPLPADFPDETLVLTIHMGYPQWSPESRSEGASRDGPRDDGSHAGSPGRADGPGNRDTGAGRRPHRP